MIEIRKFFPIFVFQNGHHISKFLVNTEWELEISTGTLFQSEKFQQEVFSKVMISTGTFFQRENVNRNLFPKKKCQQELFSKEKMSTGIYFQRKNVNRNFFPKINFNSFCFEILFHAQL